LFNPQLFLMAYGKLYYNRGAMTPGRSWTQSRSARPATPPPGAAAAGQDHLGILLDDARAQLVPI
jgi:hypothetical protein